MKHNDDERSLTAQVGQQQTRNRDFGDNVELVSSSSPALSLMGLGQPAIYLENHPEHLTAALNHRDWAVRTAAVQVLGRQGKRTPLEPLYNALHDDHASVRAMAIRALGMQVPRASLVDPLVSALRDPEWSVRAAAAVALGRFSARKALEPLVSILKDENPSVRAAVVWALGAMKERAPVELLVAALHDKAWSVREAAIMALQEQGERAPIAPLLAARWDEDRSVRDAAETALGYRLDPQHGQKIGTQSLGRLPSSWLRLALSVFSIVILIPTSTIMLNGLFIGRFAIISELIALLVVCLGILSINMIYQNRRFVSLFNRKSVGQVSSRSTIPWHGVVLAGISLIVLSSVVAELFQDNFTYVPGVTPDYIHFIFAFRLIAIGCVALTIVLVNKTFHVKH